MWEFKDGKAVFTGGKSDFAAAAALAQACDRFSVDCEEECVADADVSCYNCRYRRWTSQSFVCVKGANYN